MVNHEIPMNVQWMIPETVAFGGAEVFSDGGTHAS